MPVIQFSPITRIIGLSLIFALGFLLIILSCALYNNWRPLFDVGIFLIAPFPNIISIKIKNHYDDFMSDGAQTAGTFARFLTGYLIVSGLALPVVLYQVRLIVLEASVMSTVGGLLIYGTIIAFNWFFTEEEDDDLF